MTLAGEPTEREFGGIVPWASEFAPMTAPSPTVTGATNCVSAGQTLTCDFGVLRAHTSTQLTVDFAVGPSVSGNQLSAVLTGHESDSDGTNNRVDRTVTAAEVVKLRFFVGLTSAEVANVLGVSEKTVLRCWTHAKAWLYERIQRRQ